MAREQVAAQGAPAVDEAALAEMRRLIFDAQPHWLVCR